jgi:hypothetical protein
LPVALTHLYDSSLTSDLVTLQLEGRERLWCLRFTWRSLPRLKVIFWLDFKSSCSMQLEGIIAYTNSDTLDQDALYSTSEALQISRSFPHAVRVTCIHHPSVNALPQTTQVFRANSWGSTPAREMF